MKKFDTKKFTSFLMVGALVLPLAAEAQPFRAQYEDYEGVPKSLRKALESGSNYDSDYAVKEPAKVTTGSSSRSYRTNSGARTVYESNARSTNTTSENLRPSQYPGHHYSETEAKDTKKLGAHALSPEAVAGASPTEPVTSLKVKRETVVDQREGKRYIVDDDGTKYELKGNRVNIHDGILLPEGYEVEKKTIKIPSYQLKGIRKQDSSRDIKKNSREYDSREYLKLNFLNKGYISGDGQWFQPYQIAAEGGSVFFPGSMNEKKRVVNNEAPASQKKSAEFRRPANRGFSYTDQASYMSVGVDGSAANAHQYTMESLLASAYNRNPDINSSREALKAADEEVNQAYSGYLPELSATISNGYNNSGTAATSKQKFYPDSQSLNLSQGIFGGGETYYAVEAAKNRILAARNELRSTEQEFLLEAINSYIELIFTKKVLILAENNETILNEQLRASRERFIIGDATRTDVAQSEARLANAVSNRVVANGDYTNAKSNFKRIFQMDPPDFLPMPTSLPKIPETFDEAMTQAVRKNPDLNRAKHLLEVRDAEIDVRMSQLYPQLDLSGAVQRRDSVSGANLVETEAESLTLSLTIPLYAQGVTYSRVREANNRKKQSDFDYQAALNSVRDQVVQAWQGLTTTASNIEATKASLVASEYALEGVREEQKEGARTILDVLDAEQERFQAEVGHARAIKDSVLAVYTLKSVVGELSPSSLGLPVGDYNPEVHYEQIKNKLIGF